MNLFMDLKSEIEKIRRLRTNYDALFNSSDVEMRVHFFELREMENLRQRKKVLLNVIDPHESLDPVYRKLEEIKEEICEGVEMGRGAHCVGPVLHCAQAMKQLHYRTMTEGAYNFIRDNSVEMLANSFLKGEVPFSPKHF
jgi:hypothetical protein